MNFGRGSIPGDIIFFFFFRREGFRSKICDYGLGKGRVVSQRYEPHRHSRRGSRLQCCTLNVRRRATKGLRSDWSDRMPMGPVPKCVFLKCPLATLFDTVGLTLM